MRTITNVFMSFRSFVNSFRHTGMSRIPVPVVHPYSNDPENTAGIAVEYTYKAKNPSSP